MYFYRDGKKIYGELFLPEQKDEVPGRYPAVIIGHGMGGSHQDNVFYAKALAKHGIAAVTIDFIGGGNNIRSDGRTTEMTLMTEAADMSVVLDSIRTMPEIDRDNIFLMGESQGGFVATYVAIKRKADVRGLIALYPSYVMHEDARRETPKLPPDFTEVEIFGITVSRQYIMGILSFDIYDMLPDFDKKVLLIHGTADRVVPISGSEKAQKLFPDARLIPIEGAGHGFFGREVKEATAHIVEFIERHGDGSSVSF